MDASLLIIYFAIFIGLIWLVAIRPQSRRRKELDTILGGLATLGGRTRASTVVPDAGRSREVREVQR